MVSMEDWPIRLKRMRTRTGLSQAKVAEAIGVKPASVAQWELGRSRPDPKNVRIVAELYGVTIDELCAHDIPRPPPLQLGRKDSNFNLGNEKEIKASLHDLVETMDAPQRRRALLILRAAFVGDETSVA